MSGTTEIDGAGLETDTQMMFRHSQTINRFADYGRLFSSALMGAGLMLEDNKTFGLAAGAYALSLAYQRLRGYNSLAYTTTSLMRDGLSFLSGFIGASIISNEPTLRDVPKGNKLALELLSSTATLGFHSISKIGLRELEKKLMPRNPPLL